MLSQDTPILVTGSRGVLGTALTKLLRQSGYTNVLGPSRVELDLLSPEHTNTYLFSHKPEVIIHLAALVFGLGGNLRNQFRSLSLNTIMTHNLFNACMLRPVRHIFYAGTVASYPFPYRELPLRELEFFNGLPHGGEFGYAMAKRHAYAYLQIIKQETATTFTYGIFTNLYGEHDRFDAANAHVIPSLIAKAHAAREHSTPLSVWGDGSAERDFLHADDAARGIILCIENQSEELINISSGVGVSIALIANIVAHAAGIRVVFEPAAPTGIPRRFVDNGRLRAIGFQPKIEIVEGLTGTYDWYSKNADRARA